MRIQLAEETRQPLVEKKVQLPGVLMFENFLIWSDSNSDIASALEIAKSGANISADITVVFLGIWDVPWWISMTTIRRGTSSHGHLPAPPQSRLPLGSAHLDRLWCALRPAVSRECPLRAADPARIEIPARVVAMATWPCSLLRNML